MQAGGWPIAMDEEEWDPEEYTWQRVERYYAYLTGWLAFFEIEAIPNRFGPDANGKSFGTITVSVQSIRLINAINFSIFWIFIFFYFFLLFCFIIRLNRRRFLSRINYH